MICGSRRLHHGGVDRNHASLTLGLVKSGRLHHGGVDRNAIALAETFLEEIVASITEAWIETSRGCPGKTAARVASITEAWIETFT